MKTLVSLWSFLLFLFRVVKRGEEVYKINALQSPAPPPSTLAKVNVESVHATLRLGRASLDIDRALRIIVAIPGAAGSRGVQHYPSYYWYYYY